MSIVQSMAILHSSRFAMSIYRVGTMFQRYLVAILRVEVLWVLSRKVSKSLRL